MSSKSEKTNSKNIPQPVGPYSQVVVADGFVFCSGQIALDPITNQLINGGIREQTIQVLTNTSNILGSIGADLTHVCKVEIYLTHLQDMEVVNEIYKSFFASPYPARVTIGVSALPKNALIEIACTARFQTKLPTKQQSQ